MCKVCRSVDVCSYYFDAMTVCACMLMLAFAYVCSEPWVSLEISLSLCVSLRGLAGAVLNPGC